MQVISFMNMKGGVGKTTLTVNVAYALARLHAKKVLVVDGDPQFNATQYLMKEDDYLAHMGDVRKGTLMDIFVPRRPGPVRTVSGSARSVDKKKMALAACTFTIYNGGEHRGRLDLIPSTLNMIDIETSRRGTENMLNLYLRERATGYDYVLIDCPPTISVFTQAAILASQKYLVPVKPDPLSVIGLPLLEQWLGEYLYQNGLTVEPIGLVFTLVRGATPKRMREVMADTRATRGNAVFATHLSEATDVAESVEAHRPVFLYRPNGKTAGEIRAITEEFVKRTSGD
ncbi:MAG TPA: ParA family protein [Terriglobia bacterium]|nr:ParA family protein [Terriglobia bacterium]